MAVRGRGERASRARARPPGGGVPLPGLRAGPGLDAERLIPSARSLGLAFALLAAALGSWFLARESSLFALREVEVSGASPAVAHQVRGALVREIGTSLLELDAARVERHVEKLSTVVAATVDRAFPHTLRVEIVPERPVAVVRQGAGSWVVSERGRVIGTIPLGTKEALPRIWVRRDVALERGTILGGELAAAVVAAGPLGAIRLPPVATVRTGEEGLTLALRSGLAIRLGEPSSVRLKLAIAARILPLLEPGRAYLDVSVPDRPVSGPTLNSQVDVES